MVFKFNNNYYYLKREFSHLPFKAYLYVCIYVHTYVYIRIYAHTYTYIYIFGGVGVHLKFLPISPREGPTWLCI